MIRLYAAITAAPPFGLIHGIDCAPPSYVLALLLRAMIRLRLHFGSGIVPKAPPHGFGYLAGRGALASWSCQQMIRFHPNLKLDNEVVA